MRFVVDFRPPRYLCYNYCCMYVVSLPLSPSLSHTHTLSLFSTLRIPSIYLSTYLSLSTCTLQNRPKIDKQYRRSYIHAYIHAVSSSRARHGGGVVAYMFNIYIYIYIFKYSNIQVLPDSHLSRCCLKVEGSQSELRKQEARTKNG